MTLGQSKEFGFGSESAVQTLHFSYRVLEVAVAQVDARQPRLAEVGSLNRWTTMAWLWKMELVTSLHNIVNLT